MKVQSVSTESLDTRLSVQTVCRALKSQEAQRNKAVSLRTTKTLDVPAAVYMIMSFFYPEMTEVWGGQGLTQSALRKGLLDLVQHIPKQHRLVTFSVNGYRLTRSFN